LLKKSLKFRNFFFLNILPIYEKNLNSKKYDQLTFFSSICGFCNIIETVTEEEKYKIDYKFFMKIFINYSSLENKNSLKQSSIYGIGLLVERFDQFLEDYDLIQKRCIELIILKEKSNNEIELLAVVSNSQSTLIKLILRKFQLTGKIDNKIFIYWVKT
jgi:hypothetical protein